MRGDEQKTVFIHNAPSLTFEGTLARQIALLSSSCEHPHQRSVVVMLCEALMDFVKTLMRHVLQSPVV